MKYIFLSILASTFFFTENTTETSAISTTDTLLLADSTTIYFWTWGLVENPNTLDECDVEFQKKYGFGYKSKGKCMMDDLPRLKRYMAHNQEIERQMEMRHGENWRDKYNEEVEACREDLNIE